MGALTTFQTIAVIGAAIALIATVVAAASHAIEWRTAFLWLILWTAAAITILKPSITVAIAHALGIGRGADLVFYCAILGALVAFFVVYVRMKRLESEITRVVRHIALRESEERDGKTESR